MLGVPGDTSVASRLPGWLTEPRLVRSTDTTSRTEARSGLGPVVGGAGDTEPVGARPALRAILVVTEAQTDSVTQCDQGCDGREAQRRLLGRGHK